MKSALGFWGFKIFAKRSIRIKSKDLGILKIFWDFERDFINETEFFNLILRFFYIFVGIL